MVAAPSVYRRTAPWAIALRAACGAGGPFRRACDSLCRARAGLRRALRHRRRRRLHPRAAGREPDRHRAPRACERIRGEPLPAGRDARRAAFRLDDCRVRHSRDARRPGVAVFAGCALTAFLLRHRHPDARCNRNRGAGRCTAPTFYLLATVFFLAAAAGLMVMSQAAGIVQAYGAGTALAVAATAFITGMVGAARIAGGWLTDRFAIARVARAALCLHAGGDPQPVARPAGGRRHAGDDRHGLRHHLRRHAAAIARYWGKNAFGRVAGRLYVAWCIAAITLPVVAGWSTIAPIRRRRGSRAASISSPSPSPRAYQSPDFSLIIRAFSRFAEHSPW